MEKQFFDWVDWDEVGDFTLFFYYITLKVDLGAFTAGTELYGACLNFAEGILELYKNEDSDPTTFNLTLNAKLINLEE